MNGDATTTTTAVWVDRDAKLSVRELEIPRDLAQGEHLVRVLFSGINPADVKHVSLGVHSTVAGYDFCGEVVATGPGSDFAVGDIVAGSTPTGVDRPQRYGSHQNYLVTPSGGILFKVPENMSHPAASVLGVIGMTASDVFFNLLGYPLMDEDLPLPPGGLLIWGGTSAIGLTVLQLARAKGVSPIIVTAHPDNFALLEGLGATRCFDFRDPEVVASIRQFVADSGLPLLNILDAVGLVHARTADIAAACGDAEANVVTMTVHPTFRMPLAQMFMDTELNIENEHHIVIPKREEDAARAFRSFAWLVEHYGSEFEFPRITVYSGRLDSAIDAIDPHVVSDNDYGKRTIAHPLRKG